MVELLRLYCEGPCKKETEHTIQIGSEEAICGECHNRRPAPGVVPEKLAREVGEHERSER